ncbi:MAG: hypothetical protein M3285_11050, partial [Actinomycetota bacterium]|nr:hypothetical protein [Actinomycetota bacterium]
MNSTTEPSPRETPRPAATLVVLRDSSEGFDVLVTVRPQTMRFMGGATVFPGGGVAAEDADPRWERGAGLSRVEASAGLEAEEGPDS